MLIGGLYRHRSIARTDLIEKSAADASRVIFLVGVLLFNNHMREVFPSSTEARSLYRCLLHRIMLRERIHGLGNSEIDERKKNRKAEHKPNLKNLQADVPRAFLDFTNRQVGNCDYHRNDVGSLTT